MALCEREETMRVRTDPDSRLSEQEIRHTIRVCVVAGLIPMGLAFFGHAVRGRYRARMRTMNG